MNLTRTALTARLVGSLVAITTVVGLVAVAPAGAVGDPGLSSKIVSPTQAGWTPYPSAQVLSLVKSLADKEDLSLADEHGHATVAAQVWKNNNGYLQIALVSVSSTIGKNPNLDVRVIQSAATAATSFCVGTTGVAPVKVGTIPQIPSSVVGECAVSASKQYLIVAWAHHNVIAIIATTLAAMSLKNLVTLAKSQYSSLTSSSSNSATTVVIFVAVAVVLVVALIVALVRRRATSTRDSDENAEETDDHESDDSSVHDAWTNEPDASELGEAEPEQSEPAE
jgi:lysylphosphatidylglycerol synthetase-like protein (DUF2156 family)